MPVGSRPTIKSLLAAGKTVDEVIAQLGCKRHSVHAVRFQEGLTRINGKRTPEKDATCLAMLKAGKGFREIAKALHISQDTVRVIRVAHGLPVAPRESRVLVDTGRCECGLLLPCTCNGQKRSAVEFCGRTREPEGHSTGDHFA
jgi:DNA-binding CsgD family transcriptional regulator